MINTLITSDTSQTVLEPATIKVAIIEDRREIRDGLAMLISGTEGFKCTGTYRSMEDALPRIGTDLPDVVLCDIGLPGMSGIDGMRILKERFPNLLLLMLTIYGLAALPFFFGGLVITFAIARLSAHLNAVYASDLIGAAAGCLVLIPLLDRLGAPGVVLTAAAPIVSDGRTRGGPPIGR